jgi:hypothetical protein
MRRTCILTLAGLGALAAPAAASAAMATLDLPCYVSGQPGNLALSGYAPNAVVTVDNPDLGSTRVTTDATGSASLAFTPPSGNDLKKPGSRAFVITAAEVANPASTATATGRVAPFAFATDRGTKSPKASRSWYFSGFTVGKPIYAHFRFKAQTRGTHRFGIAKGPCGEDKRHAPGIAISGRVSPGTWTIQVDQAKRYAAKTTPKLKDTTVVFTTFRPRTAAGAAALDAVTLPAGDPFGPVAAWG